MKTKTLLPLTATLLLAGCAPDHSAKLNQTNAEQITTLQDERDEAKRDAEEWATKSSQQEKRILALELAQERAELAADELWKAFDEVEDAESAMITVSQNLARREQLLREKNWREGVPMVLEDLAGFQATCRKLFSAVSKTTDREIRIRNLHLQQSKTRLGDLR